jgi:hypothetical protein
MKVRFFFVLLALCVAMTQVTAQQKMNWKAVDDAIGRAGQDQPDGAHKYSMPRSDLKVTVDGVALKPGFALGLVLTEPEIGPVMQKLMDSGIEISALHNHLLNESPRVMYMHIHGRGDAVQLASSIHAALGLTNTPGPAPAPAGNPNLDLGIDTKQIDNTLGYAGKNNNGVYQFAVPRAEKITEGGMVVPTSMGVATSINFQPTGGGKSAITGDFVLTAKEVNPVIKALRQNGIVVTAIHSHMLEEQPRLFFMHFWANDDAIKLAKGLRAALDQTNSGKRDLAASYGPKN